MPFFSLRDVTTDWVDALIEDGYNVFPWTGHDCVRQICDEFRIFAESPCSFRRHFLMNFAARSGDAPDVGLQDQLMQNDSRKDKKQMFHYTPVYGRQILEDLEISENDERVAFFKTGALLHNALEVLSTEIVCSVGDRMQCTEQFAPLFRATPLQQRNKLRLLRYLDASSSEAGRVHSDRSFLTFHLFSSGPLQVMQSDGSAFVYHSSPEYILVFFGDKAALLTGGDGENLVANHEAKVIRPGLLRTVAHQPLNDCDALNRQAVIFFFNPYVPNFEYKFYQ